MDFLGIAWQAIGGVIGLWTGRQFVVIALKSHNLDRDNMSYREYREESAPFSWWIVGLVLLLLVSMFVFGPAPSILGLVVGVPLGYFLRKIWKINEDEMPLAHSLDQDEYTGD